MLNEQAFDQVPSFNDGQVQIFESGAILQYIGEQSETLLPREPLAKYRAIQWTYAATNSVERVRQVPGAARRLLRRQEWAEPAKPDVRAFAQLRLGRVSARLGDNQWLEGDRFTIGDLMMVSVLRIADRSGQLANFPNLAALVKRGEARPAFQRALADQLAAFREHQPEGVAA